MILQQEEPKVTGLPVKKWWATGAPGGGLEQWSPTILAPGTSFMEDNFFLDQRWWIRGMVLGMIQVRHGDFFSVNHKAKNYLKCTNMKSSCY